MKKVTKEVIRQLENTQASILGKFLDKSAGLSDDAYKKGLQDMLDIANAAIVHTIRKLLASEWERIADKIMDHASYLWAIGITCLADYVRAEELKARLAEDEIDSELIDYVIGILMRFSHTVTYAPDGHAVMSEKEFSEADYKIAFETAREALIEELKRREFNEKDLKRRRYCNLK